MFQTKVAEKKYRVEYKHTLLIGFPLQQWLRKCTPVLHHVYAACLVNYLLNHWK